MRRWVAGFLLLAVKVLSRTFFRFDLAWVGEVPTDPWAGIRVIAFLNHTSLYEPLFLGVVPGSVLSRMASHGLAPGATITLDRPILGRFYRFLLPDMVPITRDRDHTWDALMQSISPESLVVIAVEGRMKRADGLDKHGRPMTVRGGIADILRVLPSGRMLLAYSGGLHHVQVPGQRLPRLFQTLRLRLETVDLDVYRAERLAEGGEEGFKRSVIGDLEARRERYCGAPGSQERSPT